VAHFIVTAKGSSLTKPLSDAVSDLIASGEYAKILSKWGVSSSGIMDGAGWHPASDQVRGRLDAVLTAARVAPLTSHIGLMPTVVVTHTEPFHISKAIATL
jgi:alkanesulfonate monooxygenase SsuD/methylene tetrahydromethanopterin reductase-like flavin-dependent oxidoreductase (luciferase family)